MKWSRATEQEEMRWEEDSGEVGKERGIMCGLTCWEQVSDEVVVSHVPRVEVQPLEVIWREESQHLGVGEACRQAEREG